MVLAIIYYSFFALDRYASQAELVVRQPGSSGGPAAVAGVAMLIGGMNPTSREETLFLQRYITSSDMLNALQKSLDWSKHYSGRLQDPVYWLSPESYQEDILKYYQRVVTTEFDANTGLLKIKVQAFDREFAKKSLDFIVQKSEAFVNEISHRMAREQLRFAQQELALTKKVYEQKRQIMLEFQQKNKVLDLQATALARATLINEIEAKLVQQRAEFSAMRSDLSANSPQISQRQKVIEALERELAVETEKLTSDSKNEGVNALAAQYRELTIDAGIAEEAYKLSVAAVENARIEATKQLRALVAVVSPNAPDRAIYPEKIYNLFAILLGLLMLFGIFRFLAATINDHKD